MNAIVALAKRIMEAQPSFECVTDPEDTAGEEGRVLVGDDRERQYWFVELEATGHADDGEPEGHVEIKQALTMLFGVPTRQLERSDLPDRKVNNWDADGVLIVQLDRSIELFENYRKVPRRWV